MKRSETVKSSIYRRKGSPYWWVRRTVAGLGELRISTRTTDTKLAKRYDDLLCDLREHGRFDALRALRLGSVTLHDLHTHRDPIRLGELLTRTASPLVKPLLDEWFDTGAGDTGVRASSMRRYRTSWKHVLAILPEDARLSAIDQHFVTAFKRHRHAQATARGRQLAASTLNRDLAAIGAFLTWCQRERGLPVARPELKYQPESRGRTRWLTAEEISAFREHCPDTWWPLFALLFGTGMAIGEALGLRRSDFNLDERLVSIHEEHRKLKRTSRARELAIPGPLVSLLAPYLANVCNGPVDRVFPFTYWPARDVWHTVCKAAGITGATIHDARHTFAVHATMSGVPEARLQRLLGHSHPGTTRRYAMFSPGQFIREDAESVAISQALGDGSGACPYAK